jgi:hypothetical protein
VASNGRAAITPSVKPLPGVVCAQSALDKGEELRLQQLAPAREPLLHRVLTQLQIPRHRRDGLVLAIKQNQPFTIELGNAFERTPENRLFLRADGVQGSSGL